MDRGEEVVASDSIDIDDHLHCNDCYRIDCSYNRCSIRSCTECSALLHTCKIEDHLLICSKAYVPCICAAFGCPLFMRREEISQHLMHCSASAVFCAVQWNRRVLSSYAKRKLKRVAKGLEKWQTVPEVDEREIDVYAALIDQEVVIDSYQTSRKDRKRLTDFQNPCHPLMPLRISLEKQTAFRDEDSSDEENNYQETVRKNIRSPFENCYLCKLDPASQHLHVLGNIKLEENVKDVDEKPAPVKISIPPPFYEMRNLYLNITRERLSAFIRKAENLQWIRKGISVYTFCCNESFRRDEYSTHYEFSHMKVDEYIGRCPLFIDGCPFYYYKTEPFWGELRYSRYLNCVVQRAPKSNELPYDGKSICDLPLTVLCEILKYLDCSSLRCLSSTSKKMRYVCFDGAYNSAMVHIKWERSESGNWFEKCFMWEFSKCQKSIDEWRKTSTSILSNHLYECKFNVSKKYDSKWKAVIPSKKVLAEIDNA